MIVQYIDGFTNVLGAPKDWDPAVNGEVLGLPVRIEQHGDTVSCTSAWKPSPDELTVLLTGANINLRVIGGQPPVSISVDGIAEDLQVAAPSATEQRLTLMAKVLRVCGAQFAAYAESHSAKRTAEGDAKADTNHKFAKLCADVLEGLDVDPSPGAAIAPDAKGPSPVEGEGPAPSGFVNAGVARPLSDYQARINKWMQACFGPEISADGVERNHRFLEEALELFQALGCTASEAHQLVDYTFNRPLGAPSQEVGGVMVTLAALCNAHGLRMGDEAEREHDRIWTKVEAIRAKQAGKPKHSPLPAQPGITDTARLDFLDECSRRLNATYGTDYGWKVILNHNVNRLMLGHLEVDLHDSEGSNKRLPSCRAAIDEKMGEVARALAAQAQGATA